jgi:hypothetical protein
MIDDYVKNTYGRAVPFECYEIEREGEKKRFNEKIGNKMLLWHGSGMANFVGILS